MLFGKWFVPTHMQYSIFYGPTFTKAAGFCEQGNLTIDLIYIGKIKGDTGSVQNCVHFHLFSRCLPITL